MRSLMGNEIPFGGYMDSRLWKQVIGVSVDDC